MAEKFSWSEYKPSKTVWFWSCVGCIVATMVVGFTWGGWVTGGTAREMVAEASESGRAELAASICVDRFMQASDAATKLAQLREESTWQRTDFIEEGGWVTLASMDEPVEGAAGLCASELMAMEVPAEESTAAATAEGAT